jgi:hypothetical protein
MKISKSQFEAIMTLFKTFCINYKNYWKITNPTFLQTYNKKYLNSKEVKIELHKMIAHSLEGSPPSIRTLEEQTNNYYLANDFFQLKQTISSIENFILLFNESIKYDLFKFWKKLEEKGYDPIHEYNKSLELFDMHFNPKDHEIFMINIQISRFFKELSEFESPITPEFRHPLVKGKIVQAVDSIDYKFRKTREKTDESGKEGKGPTFYESDPSLKMLKINKGQIFELYADYPKVFDTKNEDVDQVELFFREETGDGSNTKFKNYLDEIGILQELKSINMLDVPNNRILRDHEGLNIEIPLNKVKFIDHFHTILNEKFSFKKKYNKKSQDDVAFRIKNEDEEKKNPDEMILLNEQEETIDNYTKMILDIDLSIEKPQPKLYYYYKRWLWMNFPWICLSKENIEFSRLIAFCYSDDKSFLDNEQETILYFKCLQIISECKEKKMAIFKPKEDGIVSKKTLVGKHNASKMTENNMTEMANNQSEFEKFPTLGKVKANSSKNILMKRSNNNQSGSIHNHLSDSITRDQRNKIISIYNKNNSHSVSINKLTMVLNKSKFLEDSIIKNNMLDMNQLIFNNDPVDINEIYKSKIDNLNLILDKWSAKEINLLRRKNEQVINELNSVVYKKMQLVEKIVKLEEQNGYKKANEQASIQEKAEEASAIISIYKKKITDIKNELSIVLDQKKRYQEIIDVCLINQISNEEWIRSLNFYLNNLRKVRLDLEKQLQVKSHVLESKKAECKKIYETYIKRKEKRELFLKNFKKYVKQKEEIDKAIVGCEIISRSENYIRGQGQAYPGNRTIQARK